MKHTIRTVVIVAIEVFICFTFSTAQTLTDITLPAPRTEGGKPLMQVLKERKSGREYSKKKLEPQQLSDLLWAAFGINRPDGKRTAPSARDCRELEIYAVMQEGVYRYNAEKNILEQVAAGDFRKMTGAQKFVGSAPLNLVYVADLDKMKGSESDKALYSSADVGFVGQNVYLFCASKGLSTVIRGWLDRDKCAKTLKLTENKKVVLAQSVGFPKE